MRAARDLSGTMRAARDLSGTMRAARDLSGTMRAARDLSGTMRAARDLSVAGEVSLSRLRGPLCRAPATAAARLVLLGVRGASVLVDVVDRLRPSGCRVAETLFVAGQSEHFLACLVDVVGQRVELGRRDRLLPFALLSIAHPPQRIEQAVGVVR